MGRPSRQIAGHGGHRGRGQSGIGRDNRVVNVVVGERHHADRLPLFVPHLREPTTHRGGYAEVPPLPRANQGFYVAAAGRCSVWFISNGLAQSTPQGPLGAVVLQFKVRASGPELTGGREYRRIGPVEEVNDQLQWLECYPCFLQRDTMVAYPWQRCSPALPARWYVERSDCEREAPLFQRSPDAGSLTGRELGNDVACELSEETERARDADDDAAYDAAQKELEAALAAGRRRLRAFQTALSRTRQVFARREERCEAWDLRQDPDSPSGWLSRTKTLDASRHLVEFRFAAIPDGVRLTGPIETPLPSRQEPSAWFEPELCQTSTTERRVPRPGDIQRPSLVLLPRGLRKRGSRARRIRPGLQERRSLTSSQHAPTCTWSPPYRHSELRHNATRSL